MFQNSEMELSRLAPSFRRGRERVGECVCLLVCLCACPAKYFLHYTANPISSFRKFCNVNARAPFTEQLGPCLPRTLILLTASKNAHTQKDFLSPLASSPPYTSKMLLPLPLAAPKAGEWACAKTERNPRGKMRLILTALSTQTVSQADSCAEQSGILNAHQL